MQIKKISSDLQLYEVEKEGVAKIQLTEYGLDKTNIYMVMNSARN
ncbi:hypothetical protein GGGNBK_11450 [Sporosarcina sp. ANT_H38]|nr:hypothetical protein [Sporosarcina sp. ANT_H38]